MAAEVTCGARKPVSDAAMWRYKKCFACVSVVSQVLCSGVVPEDEEATGRGVMPETTAQKPSRQRCEVVCDFQV